VLTDAARKGEFPAQLWTALLHETAKGEPNRRLLTAIAARLARLGPEKVAELRHPVSEWMCDRATWLLTNLPDVFQAVWDLLAAALSAHPPKDRFRRADAGWVDDGLNQPAGRMVDALFKDPAKTDFNSDKGLPAEWKTRLDQLLALPGDARRHAIAMTAPHSNWLYFIDPDWTESRLLTVADGDDADAQAFWGGYFWAARTPQLPLYGRRSFRSTLASSLPSSRLRDRVRSGGTTPTSSPECCSRAGPAATTPPKTTRSSPMWNCAKC